MRQQIFSEAEKPSERVEPEKASYDSVFTEEFRKKVEKELYDRGYMEQSLKFRECGEARAISECSNCQHPRSVPIGCGLRICPTCRIRENKKLVSKYQHIVERIKNPKHMTLTVKNVSYFNKEVVHELRDCFNKLIHRKGKKNTKKVGRKIRGGLYSLEVKKVSETVGWNIHIHVLLSSAYIKQSKLSNEWQQITKESSIFQESPIVDIRKVHGVEGLKEVLNYVSKEGEIEAVTDLVTYEEVMHNMRQIQPFGTLYNKDPKELKAQCKNCGSEDFDFLGIIKGITIQFCKTDISYFEQVLTSLDTMEISSPTNSSHPPPDSGKKEESQISSEKVRDLLSEVQDTQDRTELEGIFSEELIEYALHNGYIYEPRSGVIKEI